MLNIACRQSKPQMYNWDDYIYMYTEDWRYNLSESFQTNQSSKTRHPMFRHEWVGGWWVTPIASRRFPGGNCRCCSAAWEPATFPSTNCLLPPCLGPFWTRSNIFLSKWPNAFLYKLQNVFFQWAKCMFPNFKCVSLNYKKHLSNWQHLFVQILIP